jgi:penicillin-binding protein 2
VLAAASFPRFDLNGFQEHYEELTEDPRRPLYNRATQGLYPIGSTFKVVVATAGLAEGLLNAHTEFTCQGAFQDGAHVLKCTSLHGTLELSQAIERSCNVYFWNAGLRVGAKRMKTWAERYGLGRSTGCEIGEKTGRIPLETSRAGTLNLAIGQGAVQCTPLQVARMMGCIGTSGQLADARFTREKPVRVRDVGLTPENLSTVRIGMHDVVYGRMGTARNRAQVAGLDYAAKTGTAQTRLADVEDAWFSGFAPYRTPRVAFTCVIENSRLFGGVAAAPVMQRIFTRMMADPELRKYFEEEMG